MKMTENKARKLMGLVELINRAEAELNKKEMARFIQFDLRITRYVGKSGPWWVAEFASDDHIWLSDYRYPNASLYKTTANGYHEPSHVTLFDDDVCYYEFRSVVSFIRSALKAGDLKKLKYGTVEVVSKMTDYLDFEIKSVNNELG